MSDKTDPSMQPTPCAHYEHAECDYFSRGLCGSCDLLSTQSGSRISTKVGLIGATLRAHAVNPRLVHEIVLPPHPWQSRHKVKMAVGGDLANPTIGLVKLDAPSVDLVDCSLTPTPIRTLLAHLRSMISSQRLAPYDITTRAGELKHIIVMLTADRSQAIVRFVLRSSEAIPRIRKKIADIQATFPWVTVISCNIQPLPAAILEGPEEVILTDTKTIRELCGDLPLYLSPQSFMQVTPHVAHKLYTTAAAWVAKRKASVVLDLFCGVGGFSLHMASHALQVIGVEVTPTAIDCARTSAAELKLDNARFFCADVDAFLTTQRDLKADLIVVNPPRRGLSAALIDEIVKRKPQSIVYSSCAPETFARDAQLLQPHYTLAELTPFDMFPMTAHCEVLGFFTLH
jgi:23S rRNA (uracil747-C5)-methyltransferase